jgi:formate-dependent phosphoribosylglycinamide formyltransferase (GAR transformylase)
MSKVANSVRRGLEEAVAYARGEAKESAYRVHVPAVIDVRAIRTKLRMTQEEFASRFAAPLGAGQAAAGRADARLPARHRACAKGGPEGVARRVSKHFAGLGRASGGSNPDWATGRPLWDMGS